MCGKFARTQAISALAMHKRVPDCFWSIWRTISVMCHYNDYSLAVIWFIIVNGALRSRRLTNPCSEEQNLQFLQFCGFFPLNRSDFSDDAFAIVYRISLPLLLQFRFLFHVYAGHICSHIYKFNPLRI